MELGLSINPLAQTLARSILRLINWRLDVVLPLSQKYVLIGAPHTSIWDFPFTLLLKYATGIRLHWVGKDSLFRWPLGSILRRLGGIPVKRNSRDNFVQQVVDAFQKEEELVVAIAPEGTRGRAETWKTGFYYIALGAGVPIALGFVDYRERVVGIEPGFMPGGDLQADFERVRDFYTGKQGRHPERQGEIKIRTQ
jgi:1-acyl-sn-glycerol-3-phosphate acyltransferase